MNRRAACDLGYPVAVAFLSATGPDQRNEMKFNLSFPPGYPRVPLNEDYFRPELPGNTHTGLTGFHARTVSRTSGLEKDKARWRIVNTVLRTRPKNWDRVTVLSTPGLWWHFERLLMGKLESDGQKCNILACERDPDAFRVSAAMMARLFKGTVVPSGGLVRNEKKTRFLWNTDVFSYLETREIAADINVAWLDLTSVITETLGERLVLLSPHLSRKYACLAITLIRGREHGQIRDVIGGGKKRKRVLEGIVRRSCGDGFRIADLFDYKDSMPMQQAIFLRGATLSIKGAYERHAYGKGLAQ